MRYSRLGSSGLVVSRLAFGAMTFGSGDMTAIYKLGQKEADALTGLAIDRGVTLFDTADAYAGGQSEEMLGRALGARRKDVVIATKAGMRTGPAMTDSGLSRRHLFESIDGSLKRLGTDWTDVYIVHRPDPFTPLEETLRALDDIVRSGRARYLGFSNWPAWLAARAVALQQTLGLAPFVTGQMYYSLLTRDFEHEIAPMMLASGVGAMVWSPLAGGFLSGKYTREDPAGGGGRLTGFDFIPFDRERGYALVDVLKGVAEAHGSTPAAVALAWLLERPAVSTVVVGASRRDQLEANLAAVSLELSPEDLRRLDEASTVPLRYPGWFNAKVADGQLSEAGVSPA